MDIDKRFELISSVGEEVLTSDELRSLLESKKHPIAYDGFEPSGNIHIAQGLVRSINIDKMVRAGVRFKMWVADWHAWANGKLDGDLENIRTTGKYLIEVWKACGVDMDNVEFVWANDAMSDVEYWKTVMKVATNSTVKRIVRCSQIMGRSESAALNASQIFYPCMQCADIFHLEADICQLGMDQRKVNVLARELGKKLGFWKPVAVHHHMLMGLGKPSSSQDAMQKAIDQKMSKSRPDSSIFMTDSSEDIHRKIAKAYCPETQVEDNPVLEYCKYIIFEKQKFLEIDRPAKFGGPLSFSSYEDLVKDYSSGSLHPQDLKSAVASAIDSLVEPVRKYFRTKPAASKLLEQINSFKITR